MTAAIILAAGSSGRLGRPKQNQRFRDKSLLESTIETAVASGCDTVIVVLGANAQLVKPTIQHYPIQIVDNPDWADSISASIKAGMAGIKQWNDINRVLILLCDQPFVSVRLLWLKCNVLMSPCIPIGQH